jgi:hypothetical protein
MGSYKTCFGRFCFGYKYQKEIIMGYAKGTDGKARTVKNTLEGAVGDVALGYIQANTISTTGNAVVGNVLTNGYYYANGVSVSFGSSTTTLPAGNITYTETTPADWPSAVSNVQTGLDVLANAVANFQTGTGFTFSGPYSNDAAAAAGGVGIGQIYFGSSGGLVVRQT